MKTNIWEIVKLYKLHLFFAVLSIAFYAAFAYDLDRSDFAKLITLYGGLFYIAYLAIEKWKLPFKWLAALGILFRLVFVVAIPNLSQDFYRFLWDGRLLIQGISPYLFTPEQFMGNLPSKEVMNTMSREAWSSISIAQQHDLVAGMGSLNASHFSNYPPINQLFFALAALFTGKGILGSVIFLRMVMILADVGILYFGRKLLRELNLPESKIFWYFLSPFVIIEMTGNLHFESVMLFFVAWSLFLLYRRKYVWAAVLLGVSVTVKLLPLLFLPLFLRWFLVKPTPMLMGFRKLLLFYGVVIATVLLTFAPFLSGDFVSNFAATISLWFQNFEFNASFYYLIRWIGFQTVGWNIIGSAGKVLPVLVVVALLGLAFFRKNTSIQGLITTMLLGVSIYFLLSTTVHPWYIATPLLLSVFTKYKFPIVWSAVVVLSYSAYGPDGFDENLWLVALEYILVIGFAMWELIGKKRGNFKNNAILAERSTE